MKTNKSLNRILSILLVLCMVVQFIPLPHVHATEADPNTDTVTIYFNNTNNWEQVLAYYWSDTNNGMTDWPGVTMTGIGDGIWSIAVPADATMIIFNDSVGSQTGDLTIPTDGENQYNYDSNAWTVYGAVDESCAHTGGTQTCKGYACDTCGSWYGEPDPNAHSTTAEGDRAATCVNLAYCSVCGEEYGSLNTSNHETPDTYSYEDLGNGKHSTLYACCKADTGLWGRFHSYDPATKECVCGALQPPMVHWIIKSPDGIKDESFDTLVEVGSYYHPPTGVSFDGYDLAGWFTEPDGKGTPFTGGYMDNTGDKTYYAYFTDPVLDANMISVVTNADDPDILTRFIVAPGDSLESVAATLTALVNNPSYGITKANHTFAGITFYTDTTCTTLYTGTTVYGACAAMNWTCDTLTKQDEEPATCAQTGISEYWSCSCGKNYSDAQGMEEIPDLDAWKEGDGRTPVRDDAHTPDETTGQTCKGYWCTTCESWYGEVDDEGHTGGEVTCISGKICEHCSAEYTDKDANAHTQVLVYVNLEADGHKAYYPCCQKEADVEATVHTYESGICACQDAQQYTAAFMGYSEGLVITNPTPEHGKDYVTQLIGSAPHIEFVWINCGTTQNVPYTFDRQTRTLTIAGAYVDGNITIAARPYVEITIEPNGGEHDGSSAAFTVTANYKQTLYGVDISRNGYWLDGWNTKADGTGDGYTVDSFLATEDITLYAQWACAHTLGEVKFHDNGNGTHNGYCGNCGEALGNYEERPHNYDENTHKCACGAPETFTVTVNDGNDSIVVSLSSDTATFGEDFVAELSSDAATAPHYEIRYYDVGEDRYTDFTYENGKLTIPAANITGNLEIHIRPYVTMTFHGNGGVFQDPPTGEEDETLVRQWDYGENRRLFTERDEVRAGYGFTGFNTKADGTGTAYNASEWHIHTEDLVLYAQWEANTYSYMVETYTMDAYGRYSLTAEEEKSALYGTAVNATPADVDEGFYLDEEHTDSLLTATIPANDDLVLKVYIGRNQYAITWDLNGGTAENLEYLPKQELYDVTITIPTQIWKEGHTLSHFVDQTGKEYEILRSSMEDIMDMYLVAMPAYDATFTAVWTVNAYTLQVQDQSLDVDYGTALADALSGIAPEKTGYTFTGWKFYLDEGCEEEYTGTTMPAYEIYAQPQFEAIQYNITWDMSGCTYELSYSNELPTKLEYCVDAWIPFHQVSFFEITPPEGYTFVGFVDGNGNELEMSNSDIYRLYLTVSGDMTVKAVIEPKTYMATWETGDGGSYEKEFKFREVITIPESEIFQDTFRKSGYTLTGWEGYTEGMTMPVDGVTFTATWQINQANLAVSSGKYTGKAHAPTVTVEGLTEGEDFTVTYPADMTNVGEKTITVTGKLGGTVTVTYTIEKADAPVITFPEVLNAITYGQELGDAKLSFYENEYGSFNWAAPIGTPNAGTGDYALDFYPSDLNNYDWANYSGVQWIESRNALCVMGRVTVNKAPVTHIGTDKTVTYDGNTIDLRTLFRLDPNAGEAFWWIISEDGDGSFDENLWNYKILKIGTFTVEVRTDATDNYAAGSATAKLTVRKGTGTASVTLEGWTYGETAKIPVAEAQTNGAVTYLYTGENYSSDVAPTNAGTYTVIATFAETDLYKAATASTSFTIAKKPVTVTADAQTKTYGSDDPVLTYTVNGLVNGDKLTGELERVAGENAGSYAIGQGSLIAGENYIITYTGAELTIKPKTIGANDVALSGSLTYNGSEQTQNVTAAEGITFTVTGNKATNAGTYELTVTGTGNYTGEIKLSWSIQKAVAVVGTAPAANALTYTGEAQALITAGTTADGKLVYSLTENGAYTETIPTGTNAGDYTVWYYVKGDSNHTDSAKSSVAVKIGKAEQTITLAEPVTEAKCSATVKLPQVIAQGAITFESSDPTVAKITAEGITAVTAGTVTITVTAAETDNYKKAEKTYTLTIDHEPASTWESDGEYHWRFCACGHKADYKAHIPSAADICTEDQLCTVCERVLQEKTGHSHVAGVTPPTCTERGYTTYTCNCGDTYTADKIAALGHNYTNEWDTQCNNCGAIRIIESVPMYRLYNPNTGEHFYTGSTVERDDLVAVGWKYEGVAWNAPVEYGDPVYRVYNPVSGDHHFTMSWKEVEDLQEAGWNYEGVAWNSASSDHLPIYRLYNPNADLGAHHFTGSAEERDNLVAIGWKYEGIGWYALLY